MSIDQTLKRTEKARDAMNSEQKAPYAVAEVARAIAFEKPEYRKQGGWTEPVLELFSKYEHLLSQE